MNTDDLSYHFGLNEKTVCLVLQDYPLNGVPSAHGIDHWMRVRTNAKLLLLAEWSDASEVPPQHEELTHSRARFMAMTGLFAYVHDCQRNHDGRCFEHGGAAERWLLRKRNAFLSLFSNEEIEMVAATCAVHTSADTEDDLQQIVGEPNLLFLCRVCLDADRLDLWRVGQRPDPHYMMTARGKQVAEQG